MPRSRIPGFLASLLLIAPVAAIAQPAAAGPSSPNPPTSAAHAVTRTGGGSRGTTVAPSDPRAAAQDRELDQIGKQLLNETPRAPAGTTEGTGGGTRP